MFLLVSLFLVLLVTLLLLLRLQSQMAALVAWIVGTIAGSKVEDKEQDKEDLSDKNKSKSKKEKQNERKSATKEPAFSTTLTTPIEKVIEETINEEAIGGESVESKPSRKPKKRNKPTKKKAKSTEHINNDDDLGFSFFRAKSVDSVEKEINKFPTKKRLEELGPPIQEDPLGFSFLPIKRKSSKSRKLVKVDDFPKSPQVELFKSKVSQRVVSAPTNVKEDFVVTEKSKTDEVIKVKPQDNLIEIVNKSSGKVYREAKESKKVHAKISYASVASQRFSEFESFLSEEKSSRGLEEIIRTDVKPDQEIVKDVQTKEESIKQQPTEPLQEEKLEKSRTIYSENEFEIVGEDKTSIEEKNVDKNEELISEIASEERRLVDLIEETQNKTDEENSLEENVASKSDIEAKEESSSDIETLDSENFSADEDILIEKITEKTFEVVHNKDIEYIKTAEVHLIVDKNSIIDETDIFIKTESSQDTHESEKLSSKASPIVEENITREETLEDSEESLADVTITQACTAIEETEVAITQRSGEIDNINTELSSTSGQSGDEEVVIEQSSVESNSVKHTTEEQILEREELSVKEEISSEPSQDVDGDSPIEDQSSVHLDGVQQISAKTESVVLSQKSEDLSSKLAQIIEAIEDVDLDNGRSPPKPFRMSSGTQVRVLTLNDKEHQDSVLYRIEKNWVLQFRLGPSLLGRKVSLYCNYPKEGEDFNRNLYQRLQWSQDEGCNYSDDTALLTELTPKISGSFHYYFTYEDAEEGEHQGSGFFLVDPVLKYGKNEELPLDCIQCQTFLSKGLGPFDTWENKLKVAKESGYNMIHFTPIQELGVSNSSYSLSEQLKVNPIFTRENGEKTTFEDIERMVMKMRTDWKVVSICDIVLNHTANESKWLQEHPEVTYNCQNCPYMRPSYLLDAALHQFSLDVAKGFYEDKGIPIEVCTEEHLTSIRHYLHTDVFPKINIPELFICDINKYLVEFLNIARSKVPPSRETSTMNEELKVTQDPEFKRLGSTIDMNLAVKLYNVYRHDCFDEETRLKRCAEDLKSKLEYLNSKIVDTVNEHLNSAVENVIAAIRYFRVQQDGPKVKEVTVKNPLVSRYFTDFESPKSLKEHEDIMFSDRGRFLMAHNGWVMNSDPLRNFAAPGSNVYLRRELIAWGDSVKLRYGDKPEDSPFLWNYMKIYVEQTARIFDGIRLDNCHSTPIPVAEYLLDCGRKVRPDLYVVAELFTNSDLTDNIFVNRLGITSLIREAMSAWDSHEQGRLVYRYGGEPVGSFYQPRVRPLVPSIAHALFLDLTHDNPSPIEKRSVFDLLPSTALVNMACCASGSNRGYDELVPHHIHVVDETRQYTEWSDDDNVAVGNLRYVTSKSGIIAAKKALNDLHYHLGVEGFNQVYVDQMDPDVVAVTRHCPETHESYVLVAFTAFTHPPEDAARHQRGIRPLRVEGVLDEIVLEATLSHVAVKSQGSKYTKFQNFLRDNKWINGLSEYQVHLKEHIQPPESEIFERVDSGSSNVVQLNFKNFKPGSVAVIKVSLREDMREAVKNVRDLIRQFSIKKETELWKMISELTLPDLNRVLYRCSEEERDEGHGFDTYNIPNFGSMVYAGFQGFMSLLCNIRPSNDLGHPMCANLRDGNWMIDYIWQRLKLDEGTKGLGQWIEENTKSLKQIPRYLVPCYFDVVVTGIYVLLMEQSFNLMADLVKNGSTFVKGLSMGSLQFAAYIKSADLPTLSPNLSDPKPPQRTVNGKTIQSCVTLSAGLPHFSVGYMRNWGRDTFIALRGLFLLTSRYQDARYHILGYAACLRHGLIPNLLDGGRNSRFNCRDAIWWWLHCIKCYVEDAPDGVDILKDKVSRIFPTDESPAQPPGAVEQPLHDVIQEALTVHFQGLVFRERNAGRQIDQHMSDQGFDNQIGIHPETGFVFGGNSSNCGTWMDKMGSSEKAGNRGKPATPRDGSAVELVGLAKCVVTWLDGLHKKGLYPYDGVERTHKNGNITKWTFTEWAQKIQNSFEKHFWVNTSPVTGEIRPDLVNKRGIYKDCYGASQEWTDFQLRCNFPIAMVVAPELFNPQHAWVALQMAEKHLLGPLGMKTLDPDDWAYNGNYDNSNDSDNHNVAHGFNYHQGPEWVWPVGFYLRAKLQFAAANGELEKTVASTKVVLSRHFVELQTSTWRGLPELTNQNGAYCKDSSRTQAWSMSCILEVLHDLQKIEKDQPLIN